MGKAEVFLISLHTCQPSISGIIISRIISEGFSELNFEPYAKVVDAIQNIADQLDLEDKETMTTEEKEIFKKGYELVNDVQRSEWVKAVEKAKEKATNEQKVQFIYPEQPDYEISINNFFMVIILNDYKKPQRALFPVLP